MRPGRSDHNQSVLNTSVNNPQEAFKTRSLKALPEAVGDAFHYVHFVQETLTCPDVSQTDEHNRKIPDDHSTPWQMDTVEVQENTMDVSQVCYFNVNVHGDLSSSSGSDVGSNEI